jgi:hypothetical protein
MMKASKEDRMATATKTTKKKAVFIYNAVGLDAWENRHGLENGTKVVKTQPFGCPKNGTMGHCYVASAETGAFIGLVLVNSLTATREKVEVAK